MGKNNRPIKLKTKKSQNNGLKPPKGEANQDMNTSVTVNEEMKQAFEEKIDDDISGEIEEIPTQKNQTNFEQPPDYDSLPLFEQRPIKIFCCLIFKGCVQVKIKNDQGFCQTIQLNERPIANISSATVNVPIGKIKLRFYYKYVDEKEYKEEYYYKKDLREFNIDYQTPFIAIVLKEHFTGWSREEISRDAYIRGCVHMIAGLAHEYVHSELVYFYHSVDLTTFTHDNVIVSKDYSLTEIWNGLQSNTLPPEELFIKRVMLIEKVLKYTGKIYPVKLIPQLNEINALNILQYCLKAEYVSNSIRNFLSDIFRNLNIISTENKHIFSWAILMLIISSDNINASNILASDRMNISQHLIDFIPHLDKPTFKKLNYFPNITTFQSFIEYSRELPVEDQGLFHELLISPQSISSFVKTILSSQNYIKSINPESFFVEFKAIQYFAKEDSDLLPYLLYYNFESFKISSIVHQPLDVVFREAVLFVIESSITLELKEHRVDEFKVVARRSNIPELSQSVYKILNEMVTKGHQDSPFFQSVQSLLPSTWKNGLRFRINDFLSESIGTLETIEEKLICDACSLEENDPTIIRNFISESISYSCPYPLRVAKLLAVITKRIFNKPTHELISKEDTKKVISIIDPNWSNNENNENNENITIQSLFMENIREIFFKVQNESRVYSTLLQCKEYNEIYLIVQHTLQNLKNLSQAITNKNLLYTSLEVLLEYQIITSNLTQFIPSFDPISLINCKTTADKIKTEWNNLSIAFRDYMPKHPQFKSCSEILTSQVLKISQNMFTQPINVWKSPDYWDLRDLAESLNKAQDSYIYSQIWRKQCQSDTNLEVSHDHDQALIQWKNCVNLSLKNWTKTIQLIHSREFKSIDLYKYLSQILNYSPSLLDIPTQEVQARDAIRRNAKHIDEYRNQRLHSEVDITFKVLHGIHAVSRDQYLEVMSDYLSAISFLPHARNLLALSHELRCPIDTSNNLFEEYLRITSDDQSSIGQVIDIFNSIRIRYPHSLQITNDFPSIILSLIQEHGNRGGLLPLLRGLKDKALLNQIVNRKIAEVDPAAHILLVGLQEARDAFDITLHEIDCFQAFSEANMPNFIILCEYLSTISWSITIARKLIHGIDAIFGLLYDNVSGTSTITQVYALQNSGEFIITLPNGNLTATYQEKNTTIELNSIKLEDIPFQLCLTGSTIETNNDNDIGIHNRQQLFLKFMQLINSLREILHKLSTSGHPSYQNSKLIIPGSVSIEHLTNILEEERNTYFEWQDYLSEIDHTLPLLTCLSRNQFVTCLQLISTRDNPIELAEILRSICPLISQETALNITNIYLNSLGSIDNNLSCYQLSQQIHNLLERLTPYFFPEKKILNQIIQTEISTLKNKIPEKLLDPKLSTMVLKLPLNYITFQIDILCSLYIIRLNRLPVSIEVLTCTKDTTELEASDFIRRWAVSSIFMDKYLNSQQSMFCIINTEQLKPAIQNTILPKIHSIKQKSKVPLIIIASTSDELNSILCSGLRSDWISGDFSFIYECKSLLKEYFPIMDRLVHIYSSNYPSSGKTTSILHDHVVLPPYDTNDSIGEQPYSKFPLSGNIKEVIHLLKNMDIDRKECDIQNIVIHFNITNLLDIQLLNNFFLNFIILGTIIDDNSNYYVRNRLDTIIFEWPSEGIISIEARNNCTLSSSFNQNEITHHLHLSEFIFRPCNNTGNRTVFYVDKKIDENLTLGTKMMMAYFNTPPSSFMIPHRELIHSMILPNSDNLYNFILDILSSIPYSSEFTPAVIYRFHRFFSNQLLGLYNWNLYQIATIELEKIESSDKSSNPVNHSKNYRRLAYHFARCSYKLALDLASEAVVPLTEEYKENDTRHENLKFTFTNLRDKKFLIFSEGNTMPDMVSISGNIFLSEITHDDKDKYFQRFLSEQHKGYIGQTLQGICNQLSDKNYDPARELSDNHALEKLISILGDRENFGVLIFNTLKRLVSSNCPMELSSDQPIDNIPIEAREELNNIIIQDGSIIQEIDKDSLLKEDKRVLDFTNRAETWFKHICGSYMSQSPPFVLTVDNIVRLLAIKLRLTCKIPIVLVGETGSGKTHLISFYSRISGCFFEVINIHGGMTSDELCNRIFNIIYKANGKKVVILLDEINSMPSVWTIKELVCERFILGKYIPDNVNFICIMNPRRRRKLLSESCGLDYSRYQIQEKKELVHTSKQLNPLVYEVHRSPESLMSLVWDFGNPSDSYLTLNDALQITHGRTSFPSSWSHVTDEIIFAESMIHWLITSQLGNFNNGIEVENLNRSFGLSVDFRTCDHAENDGVIHYKFLKSLFCVLIKESQDFIRGPECYSDISAVSLRDITRTVNLIPFIMKVQQKYFQLDPSMANQSKYLYFKFLEVAIHVSFVLNYALRLGNAQRTRYYIRLKENWNMIRDYYKGSISDDFLPIPQLPSHIYDSFDEFATKLCGYLVLEDGMAINEALKENVTSLFCSIMGNQDTGIAQFIVGRPGSTKSSSLDILCASTDPNSTDHRCKFFRSDNWFQIRKFVLQCTPTTTADDIIRVAKSAANYQSINPLCRCVIVLEEVGVTVGSKYNPLMVLHGLVDRGVLMEDGKYIRLPIIGISNWRLDASKMNRMRTTHRGNPSVNDLMHTANCIVRGKSAGGTIGFDSNAQDSLRNFAQVFYNLILNDQNTSDDGKELAWFYGMRDFYAFVQLLHLHYSIPLSKELGLPNLYVVNELDPHLIRWAAKICFGGHPNSKLEDFLITSIINSFYSNANQRPQPSKWYRNEIIDNISQEKYFCDMCCRTDFIANTKLNHTIISDDPGDLRKYFISTYSKASTGRNCLELDNANRFSTLKVLTYLLDIQRGNLASFGRKRHVLIFTKANAALHLLRSLQIAQQEQSIIIFGRSEPSLSDILEDILRVRRAMLSGKVLILVGAKHLYESMYDALNQHYSVEGRDENQRYYTRLTMNGYTASFPIHQSFRCIVIEQLSTCKSLLPPFINRFAKCLLDYSSALSIHQRNLSRTIKSKSKVQIDIQDNNSNSDNDSENNNNDNSPKDILKLLIPGYSEDTIDSLAFFIPTEKLIHGSNFQLALQFSRLQLSYLCSPRRLQQLTSGMFEGFSNDHTQEIIQSWIVKRSHILIDDIKTIQELHPNIENVQHLFLLTEQRCISYEDLCNSIKEVYENSIPGDDHPLDINRITSDLEITEILNKLQIFQRNNSLSSSSSSSSNIFYIAIFDTTFSNCNEQLERFLYNVNATNLNKNIHIVIVGIVRNSSIPGIPIDNFYLHLSQNWIYLFMDEILSSSERDTLDSLPKLLDYNTSIKEQKFINIMKPELFRYYISNHSLSIAQRIKQDASEVSELSDDISDIFRNYNNITKIISKRICEQFQHLDNLNYGNWISFALKKVRQTDSLRQQLSTYLSLFSEKCILKYATYLFSYNNYKHLLSNSSSSLSCCNYFLYIFQLKSIIIDQDLSNCYHVDLPCIIEENILQSYDNMFDNNNQIVQFPFSFLLYHIFKSLTLSHSNNKDNNKEILEKKYHDIFRNLIIPSEIELLYVNDILNQKGVKDNNQLLVIYRLIDKYIGIGNKLGIIRIHEILEINYKELDAIIRIVTNPIVHIDKLLRCSDSNMIDHILLQSVLNSKGIINLSVSSDLILLMGDTYSLRLHHAVAIGISNQPDKLQIEAGEFIRRCQDNYELLINEFTTLSEIVCILSKFLLPVLINSIEPEYLQDKILILLDFVFHHFNQISLTSVSYLLKNSFSYWIEHVDDQRLFDILSNVVRVYGVASEQSLQISRCIFDYCQNNDDVLRVLDKYCHIQDDVVRTIVLSGALTSGLGIICEYIRTKLVKDKDNDNNTNANNNDDDNDNDDNTNDDDDDGDSDNDDGNDDGEDNYNNNYHNDDNDNEDNTIEGLGVVLYNHMLRYPSLIEECSTFTLRILSEGGVELVIAQECLQHYSKFIPPSILTSEIVNKFQTPVDNEPSIFGLFENYYNAKATLLEILQINTSNDRAINQFCNYNEISQVLAFLELGFCERNERNLKELNILRNSIKFISSELFQKFVTSLLNTQDGLLIEMPIDLKYCWIFTVIHMITVKTPIMEYYSNIIFSNNPTKQYPKLSDDISLHTACYVNRFLYSCAAIASVVFNPNNQVNYGDIQNHFNRINEDILTIKCPICKRAMNFWPDCFAVTCECNGKFCGWCLSIMSDDAHAHTHVRVCSKNPHPGSLYGNEQEYYDIRNKERIQKLQLYFNSNCTSNIRSIILDEILLQLNNLNISTDKLGTGFEGYPFKLSYQRMENCISSIKKSLFIGSITSDPVCTWLNGLIYLNLSKITAHCDNEDDSMSLISQEISNLNEPNIFLDTFRVKINEQMNLETTLNSILVWDNNYNVKINDLSHNELIERLPHHYAFRRGYTPDMFWEYVKNNKNLEFLYFLYQREESLKKEYMIGIVNILQYLSDVIRICNYKQITIKQSKLITLEMLSNEYNYLSGQRLQVFCNSMKLLYNMIERYNCQGIDSIRQAFGHLEFNKNILLYDILPHTSDFITIIPVIFRGISLSNNWQGLGIIQNDTVQILQRIYNSPKQDEIQKIYNITMNDVVLFDLENDLYNYLTLFIEPYAIPTLTNDIWILQHQIIHNANLWGKQLIITELPEFEYYEDKRKSIFYKVTEKLGKFSIPKIEIQNTLLKLVEEYPDFGSSCLDYLIILTMEMIKKPLIITTNYYRLKDFGDSIDIPLTNNQIIGKEYLSYPTLSRELLCDEIVSLCALLWNGTVIEEATIPLKSETIKLLEEQFQMIMNDDDRKLVIPYLLIGIRTLGLQDLCIYQSEEILRTPFTIYLELLMGDYYQEFLDNTVLSNIPIRHYQSVFEISEKIFRKYLTKKADEDNLNIEYEVPLAALQAISENSDDEEKNEIEEELFTNVSCEEYKSNEDEDEKVNEEEDEEDSDETKNEEKSLPVSRWEGQRIKISLTRPVIGEENI